MCPPPRAEEIKAVAFLTPGHPLAKSNPPKNTFDFGKTALRCEPYGVWRQERHQHPAPVACEGIGNHCSRIRSQKNCPTQGELKSDLGRGPTGERGSLMIHGEQGTTSAYIPTPSLNLERCDRKKIHATDQWFALLRYVSSCLLSCTSFPSRTRAFPAKIKTTL